MSKGEKLSNVPADRLIIRKRSFNSHGITHFADEIMEFHENTTHSGKLNRSLEFAKNMCIGPFNVFYFVQHKKNEVGERNGNCTLCTAPMQVKVEAEKKMITNNNHVPTDE